MAEKYKNFLLKLENEEERIEDNAMFRGFTFCGSVETEVNTKIEKLAEAIMPVLFYCTEESCPIMKTDKDTNCFWIQQDNFQVEVSAPKYIKNLLEIMNAQQSGQFESYKKSFEKSSQIAHIILNIYIHFYNFHSEQTKWEHFNNTFTKFLEDSVFDSNLEKYRYIMPVAEFLKHK